MTGPRDAATRKADTLANVGDAGDRRVGRHRVARGGGAPGAGLARLDRGAAGRGGARGLGTARDLDASGRARLAVGPTRDVTMVDAVLERAVPTAEAGALGEAYAAQADWDPRGSAGYVYLVLRPERVQAWREADEIAGRTLMRDGAWLV